MSARHFSPFLLVFAALSALAAAAATPAPGIDPSGAIPNPPPAAAIKSADTPAASTPTAANAATGSTVTAATTNATTAPAGAAAAPKPGIFSAVKAKGPPPVGKASGAAIPLSPRFQQIRERIGTLFDNRNVAGGPVTLPANPFRPAGAGPVASLPASDGSTPVPVALNGDLTSLQQAVATIRVKGTVTRNKILQLVINTGPGKEGTYKEGDVINVALPASEPVHLRVRQISVHSVTLTVNEAEMVLKF
jgi:hypothetical protein